MSDSQAKSIFIDLVNRGHAIYREKIWLDKVVQIYHLFNKHHKSKVGLLPGPGVVRNFEKKLHKHFPDIHKAILNFIAHLLTYGVRLRTINRLAKSKTQSLRYTLYTFGVLSQYLVLQIILFDFFSGLEFVFACRVWVLYCVS